MKWNSLAGSKWLLLALSALLISACGIEAASAATITGTVTNDTKRKPSAGDAVVLISLQQRMQEVAKAKTDAGGHFSIESPDAGMHLIRVDHQGAAYFQPVPPNVSSVDVSVYDVEPVVAGVSTEANVMRVETDQQGLRVTESFFVKNASTPPRTQFSNHSYEIYLPTDARIEGSAAMGPGGMPVRAFPAPLGEKGHYSFLFPIRPGETQFQLAYHLPYSGSYSFTPRVATAVANYVVMLPKSMTFKPAAGASYQPVDQQPSVQTYLIRDVKPTQSLAFSVSGTGAMPRDSESGGGQDQGGAGAGGPGAGGPGGDASANSGGPNPAMGPGATGAATDQRPGGGLGEPIDTPDPLNKYKWWILGGIFLALAVAAAFLLRKPNDPLSAAPPLSGRTPVAGPAGTLAALKDELFALETDHVQGKLSDEEYNEQKTALELVLRRALKRKG